MRFTKHTYLNGFTFIVILLALGRCAYDYSYRKSGGEALDSLGNDSSEVVLPRLVAKPSEAFYSFSTPSSFKDFTTPHKIYSVPDFKNTFPDENDIQLIAADSNGVVPPRNRADAERRMTELVYVGANPYYYIDELKQSIPYLVPKASLLLQDIGRSFYDSLFIKGIPMHQIIITSVLRTDEDVVRLRRFNHNATENSCHRYGTTFDICYNRYKTVETADQPLRQVRNDTLKWVLSEVLRDKREEGRCYIKYEVHQSCFHITVR